MRPERFRRLRSVLDRRQPDLTVLMERVDKGHNFSAILRTCDAVGVLEVHAVSGGRGLSLHRASSAGSAKWMRVRLHEAIADALGVLQEGGHQVVAAHPGREALDFRAVDYTRPTAILVGTELYGVSVEAREAADLHAVIPMAGMVRSLNVSVATALFLYEAQRQREEAGLYRTPRLQPEDYRRILFEWAHPRFAARYREAGLPYPPLSEEGEILGPPLPPSPESDPDVTD
jgi:tRNA (guanosine-2'-O-)-methyltransferase